MRALIVGLVLGLCGLLGIGAAVHRDASTADVNEIHTLLVPTDLGDLVPAGSTVQVECELPAGAGYLAIVRAPVPEYAYLVITVTAAQLDSAPRGPFPESCAHWQQRHHVTPE